MLVNTTYLQVGCDAVVDLCRSRAWWSYGATNSVLPVAQLSPLTLSMPCSTDACCCPSPVAASAPVLTGAPWYDPNSPASGQAMGFFMEQAVWSGITNSEGGELVAQFVAVANTEAGLAVLVRWLKQVTERCPEWPDVTFAEHCTVGPSPTCATGVPAIVDDGRRTMVEAERVTFAQQIIENRLGLLVETINVTWRTKLPLLTGRQTTPVVPLTVVNPQESPQCFFWAGEDLVRRYRTVEQFEYCEPSSTGDPIISRIGCMSTLDDVVVDFEVSGESATKPLWNLRIEIWPWPRLRPLPTAPEMRRLIESDQPCAQVLVGRLLPTERLCVKNSRRSISLRPHQRTRARGIRSFGDWAVRPRTVKGGYIIVVWPSADEDAASLSATPAGWTITHDYHLAKGSV
jgi:hypothetical protein